MGSIYHHDNIGTQCSEHPYYDSPCPHGPCSLAGGSRAAGCSAGHTRKCEAAGRETGNPQEFS